MFRIRTYSKKKLLAILMCIVLAAVGLSGRLVYLMVSRSKHYTAVAEQLHQRERSIKAERGIIYDRNGVPLAINRQVSTISVIHSQIKEPEKVAEVISKLLDVDYQDVLKKVNKNTSREKIKTNVDKKTADKLRAYKLEGVKIDEDYLRYYPYDSLASKVIGFTGSDNQGIVGLEVKYDKYLQGKPGTILTLANAKGVEIKNAAETRVEPEKGNDLTISLDLNIQTYAEELCKNVMEEKKAKKASMIVMNPQNGEIYAMVNVPEYNLNDPFTLITTSAVKLSDKQKQDELNKMWRNACINDTYEPGSTFKVFTAAAALSEKVVSLNSGFHCPGYKIVEDRRIRCHKAGGHGSETFVKGVQNSCNPVFMECAARVGVNKFYTYFKKFGFYEKTGIDINGEATAIVHQKKNVKAVELATMSFGQSFQITPLQLLRMVSAVVNGGRNITPHFGVEVTNQGKTVEKLAFGQGNQIVTPALSRTMRTILESVVSEGSGRNCYIEGYEIGGKTATSEKLPRGNGKYISSFVGFAPASKPQVAAILLVDEPVGVYYGSTVTAPVIKKLFENILPYLGFDPKVKKVEKNEE